MLQISQSCLQVRLNSLEVEPKCIFLTLSSSSKIPIASTYLLCSTVWDPVLTYLSLVLLCACFKLFNFGHKLGVVLIFDHFKVNNNYNWRSIKIQAQIQVEACTAPGGTNLAPQAPCICAEVFPIYSLYQLASMFGSSGLVKLAASISRTALYWFPYTTW